MSAKLKVNHLRFPIPTSIKSTTAPFIILSVIFPIAPANIKEYINFEKVSFSFTRRYRTKSAKAMATGAYGKFSPKEIPKAVFGFITRVILKNSPKTSTG